MTAVWFARERGVGGSRTGGRTIVPRARRRVRLAGYRSLERSPALFCAVLRRRVHTVNVVTLGTDLVIEAFPRSASSFAREAVLAANPGLAVASHVHRAAHVLRALELGVPVLVVVRDVDDAVSSAMFLDQFDSPEDALLLYRRFYRALWPHRDRIVVATFEQVVGGMDSVTARLNARFGIELRAFQHTPEAIDMVYERLDSAASDEHGGLDRWRVARPSTGRAKLAERAKLAVQNGDAGLRADCLTEAARFRALAECPSHERKLPQASL